MSLKGCTTTAGLFLGPLGILAAIATLITAVSTTYWLQVDVDMPPQFGHGTINTHAGLFKMYTTWTGADNASHSGSVSWGDTSLDTKDLDFTIALLIIPCIIHLVSFVAMVIMALVCLAKEEYLWKCNYPWLVASIINAFGFYSMHTFQDQTFNFNANKLDLTIFDHGYSYHLGWAAIVMVVVSCSISNLVATVVSNDESEVETRSQGVENPGYVQKQVV